MAKKIITLALAVVLCLSVIISVTAADTLVRVSSTLPGTDIEYNYVENVTVKIPGTEVTYDLSGVYEKVGLTYENGIPIYRFAFLEKSSGIILNQAGEYRSEILFGGENMLGDALPWEFESGDELWPTFNYRNHLETTVMTREIGLPDDEKVITERIYTVIYTDNSCVAWGNNDLTKVAKVEFWFGYGGVSNNGFEQPYDLISTDGTEMMDISVLDVNYVAPVNYNIIDGANSVVNSEASSLTIKADGDFSKFTGVKVDGELVDENNYTATEGSTIIEFTADYLKTLGTGTHTVSIIYTDGEATTQFEIKEAVEENNDNKKPNGAITDVEIPNIH